MNLFTTFVWATLFLPPFIGFCRAGRDKGRRNERGNDGTDRNKDKQQKEATEVWKGHKNFYNVDKKDFRAFVQRMTSKESSEPNSQVASVREPKRPVPSKTAQTQHINFAAQIGRQKIGLPNNAIPSDQGNQQHLIAKAVNANRQMVNEAFVGYNPSQTKQQKAQNYDQNYGQIGRNTMPAQGTHQISQNLESAYALSAVPNNALLRPDQQIGTHSAVSFYPAQTDQNVQPTLGLGPDQFHQYLAQQNYGIGPSQINQNLIEANHLINSEQLFESNLRAPPEDVQYFMNTEFKSDKTIIDYLNSHCLTDQSLFLNQNLVEPLTDSNVYQDQKNMQMAENQFFHPNDQTESYLKLDENLNQMLINFAASSSPNNDEGNYRPHLLNSSNHQQGLLQHSPLDSDYHLTNPFGASSSSQMQQNPSNYFRYQNVPHNSANIDQSEVETKNTEQMANENEKRRMKRPIVEDEATKSEAKAKMEKKTKNQPPEAVGRQSASAGEMPGRSSISQSEKQIVQQVLHIVGLTLAALGKDSSSINSDLKLIYSSGSPNHDQFFAKLFGTMGEIKPNEVVAHIQNWILNDELIRGNTMYSEMIGEIDGQIGTAFGQSLLNELIGKESSEDFSRTRVLFFYRRLYRKLIGLLEAPYDKSDAHKYKDFPKKSQRVALIVWLIGARKYLYREFASSLRLINSTHRDKIVGNTLLIDSDLIEQWKEEMNLVFFAVEMTFAPLIGGNVLDRSELLKQTAQQQNIVCLLKEKAERLDLKLIVWLTNETMAPRVSYAITFKQIMSTALEEFKAKYSDQNMSDFIFNANIYALLYGAILKIALSSEKVRKFVSEVPNYEDESWNMIKQFLIKSVDQLNQLINKWEQNANPKLMDKRRANANSDDIFTEKI
ncbi:hypothetical protein niasHT_021044 [Heterodera trifolii]|uniref:Uncharacterized protein n=1 Tax=Heterodera trifolii TaxID=157864 RepID=A0ABD2KDP3_9BILA